MSDIVREVHDEVNNERSKFIALCMLGGALGEAITKYMGKGGFSILRMAGKALGREMVGKEEGQQDDLLAAIRKASNIMSETYMWEVVPRSDVLDDGRSKAVEIACRRCLICNILYRYNYDQGLALCRFTHGILEGILETLTSSRCMVEIIKSGPNACYKKIHFYMKN